jgi:hypothetical protein
MKIETKKINEIGYDEITNEEQNVKEGDILLIKDGKLDEWTAQFVTLLTHVGMYLHSEKEGLDGGGVILWPEYMKEQKSQLKDLYNNARFIHIPIS